MSFANHSQLLRTRRRLRNHANSRKYGQARISFDSEAGGPHKLILSQNSLDGDRGDQGPQCVVPGQPWQPQQGDITSFSFYFCAQNFPPYTMRMTAQNEKVWGIRAALARIGARSLFNPYMCVCGRKKWPTTACGRFPRMFRDYGHQPPVGWTLLQNQATLSLKQSCFGGLQHFSPATERACVEKDKLVRLGQLAYCG